MLTEKVKTQKAGGEAVMLVTDLGKTFGIALWEQRMQRSDVCAAFKITPGSLSRLLHKPMPTPQLVEILDTMGYDIELTLVRKKGTGGRDAAEVKHNE